MIQRRKDLPKRRCLVSCLDRRELREHGLREKSWDCHPFSLYAQRCRSWCPVVVHMFLLTKGLLSDCFRQRRSNWFYSFFFSCQVPDIDSLAQTFLAETDWSTSKHDWWDAFPSQLIPHPILRDQRRFVFLSSRLTFLTSLYFSWWKEKETTEYNRRKRTWSVQKELRLTMKSKKKWT